MICQCIEAKRVVLLPHFMQRMEQRGVFWTDLRAMIDEPTDVRDDGLDNWARPRWIVTGEAADGLPLGMVLVLGRDCDGQVTVFITSYWEDGIMARKSKMRRSVRKVSKPNDDMPYTMKLPDGRTVFVLVPGKWTREDVSGEVGFTPDGVRFLDRIRALAIKAPNRPTPGYIVAVREALGLTQAQLAERLGVDSMTVSRWERGAVRPSADSIKALQKFKAAAARKGVTVAA